MAEKKYKYVSKTVGGNRITRRVEVKPETRTAGRSGNSGMNRAMPPRHSKNEMGTSGKKEREAKKATPPKPTRKPTKAKAAPAKKKAAPAKKKSGGDKDWYNKAVRRGFGRVQ